jgi:hypothetical protein
VSKISIIKSFDIKSFSKMRFLQPLSILLGLVSAVPANNAPQAEHPAVASLGYTSSQLGVLVQELNAFTGDPLTGDRIIRHAQETLGSLSRCVQDVKNGPTFDIKNTLSVGGPLTTLDYEVHQLANALKSKKDIIDKSRMGPIVYNLLKQTFADTSELSTAIVAKLPIGVSALVGVLSSEIVSTISNIRDLYRPATDVTIIIADPSRPVSGGYSVRPNEPGNSGFSQSPYQSGPGGYNGPNGPGNYNGPSGPGNYNGPNSPGSYSGPNGPGVYNGPSPTQARPPVPTSSSGWGWSKPTASASPRPFHIFQGAVN